MKSKRGLSGVVTTLIMILLALVAVGIVWVVISNVIDESSSDISIDSLTGDLEIKNVLTDITGCDADISIKRTPGGGDMTGVRISVYDSAGASESFNIYEPLEELDLKVYNVTTTSCDISYVSVVPIYSNDKGEDRYGIKISNYNMSEGGIVYVCGDSVCNGGETCVSCEADCGVCPECFDNSDCSAPTPYCDTSAGSCVECLVVGDCTGDGNVCTTTTCSSGICGNTNNANSCNDNISCTEGDVCSGGSCSGTPNDALCGALEMCSTTLGCVMDTSDMFSWWDMNGDAADSIGDNDGIVNGGATLTTGKSGQAYHFNGTNSNINLSIYASEYSTLTNGTISFWFKTDSESAGNFFNFGNIPNGNQFRCAYYGYVFCQMTINSLYPINFITAYDPSYADGTWKNIVVTMDSSEYLRMYLNGNELTFSSGELLLETDSYEWFNSINSPDKMLIGNNFIGDIDEVMIFDRALTPAQVSALYSGVNTLY